MVVWVTEIPRSAIMITRSRKLSLKLVYQLTHKTMIGRSKWRPLNKSSIGTNLCISFIIDRYPRVCTRAFISFCGFFPFRAAEGIDQLVIHGIDDLAEHWSSARPRGD